MNVVCTSLFIDQLLSFTDKLVNVFDITACRNMIAMLDVSLFITHF